MCKNPISAEIQGRNYLVPEIRKKTLTNRTIYDIVDGRMEEPRSFFYAQIPTGAGEKRDLNIKNLSGGGSRAYKNYTGMHRM